MSNLIVSVFILSPLCEKFRDNKKESSRDIITLIDSLSISTMIISHCERIALGKACENQDRSLQSHVGCKANEQMNQIRERNLVFLNLQVHIWGGCAHENKHNLFLCRDEPVAKLWKRKRKRQEDLLADLRPITNLQITLPLSFSHPFNFSNDFYISYAGFSTFSDYFSTFSDESSTFCDHSSLLLKLGLLALHPFLPTDHPFSCLWKIWIWLDEENHWYARDENTKVQDNAERILCHYFVFLEWSNSVLILGRDCQKWFF